jgi:Fe-S cluster assembly ATPase SufC
MTLMGHPTYTIVDGNLFLDGISLKELAPDERAKR